MVEQNRAVTGQNEVAEQSEGAGQSQAERPKRFRNQKIFSTPLISSHIGNASFRDALERAILKRREEDPGIQRSNVGGWHSDIKILDWGGNPARILARQVVEFANDNTMRADGKDGALRWVTEGWANVNEQGQSNARHIHGGCYWSAVYYVRVPPGDSGKIIFYDPRMPSIAMHAPRLRFRDAHGERIIRIKPQTGQLLMFPSWLDHEVEPWTGEGMRISIALNLLAAPDLPAPATVARADSGASEAITAPAPQIEKEER